MFKDTGAERVGGGKGSRNITRISSPSQFITFPLHVTTILNCDWCDLVKFGGPSTALLPVGLSWCLVEYIVMSSHVHDAILELELPLGLDAIHLLPLAHDGTLHLPLLLVILATCIVVRIQGIVFGLGKRGGREAEEMVARFHRIYQSPFPFFIQSIPSLPLILSPPPSLPPYPRLFFHIFLWWAHMLQDNKKKKRSRIKTQFAYHFQMCLHACYNCVSTTLTNMRW